MSQVHSLNEFPSYKGGDTLLYGGYIFEYAPFHHLCNLWGFVAQHRLIAEDILGRALERGEHVHHTDENPLNNAPGNLEVLSKAAHHRLHALKNRGRFQAALTEQSVREALQGHTLKEAAAIVHVHPQTLRNRFPALLAPRKRKSPTQIDDPAIVETIRQLAPDPAIGYREIAQRYGIAMMTVKRMCERFGIVWVKKTRKGEKHRQYRRRTATPPA